MPELKINSFGSYGSPFGIRPVDEIEKFPNGKKENKKKRPDTNNGESNNPYKDPFLGNKLDVKA